MQSNRFSCARGDVNTYGVSRQRFVMPIDCVSTGKYFQAIPTRRNKALEAAKVAIAVVAIWLIAALVILGVAMLEESMDAQTLKPIDSTMSAS